MTAWSVNAGLVRKRVSSVVVIGRISSRSETFRQYICQKLTPRSIMAKRGPALEFLGLSYFQGTERMVNALTHCRSLRHLKIWYPTGELEFAPVWKSLGVPLSDSSKRSVPLARSARTRHSRTFAFLGGFIAVPGRLCRLRTFTFGKRLDDMSDISRDPLRACIFFIDGQKKKKKRLSLCVQSGGASNLLRSQNRSNCYI